MKYEKLDEIEIETGKKYTIVDVLNFESKEYLLLINSDENNNNIAIVEKSEENGETVLQNIESEEEFEKVSNEFYKNNKDIIKKVLND